jgi:Protein of unknown function (DUF2589)
MAKQKYSGEFQEGAAAKAVISMSQLILGPLEAILKSQVHASRSFLNMILQLGYPHIEVDENGAPKKDISADQQGLYMQEFKINTKSAAGVESTSTIKIPALALVPIAPLSIEQADFQVEFKVSHVFRHQQIQESEVSKMNKNEDSNFGKHRRPWFLVKDPISIRGVIASKVSDEIKDDHAEEGSIKVNIKISRQAMPAGIDKLLTSLTQVNDQTVN